MRKEKPIKEKEPKRKLKKERWLVGWLIYYPQPPKPTSQPPNFFVKLIIIQPTMPTFEQLWQLFLDRGALANRRDETANIWNTYTPEQQQQIYDTITTKLNQGRFVHYNPQQAIRENANKLRLSYAEPTNYFGRPLPRGLTFYRADYHGTRGLYTEEDVKTHHMSNPELFMQS